MTDLVSRYAESFAGDRYAPVATGGLLLFLGLAFALGLIAALVIAIVVLTAFQVALTLAQRTAR